MVVQRDQRAAERGAGGKDGASRGAGPRRYNHLFIVWEIRRQDPGARAGARRARPLRGRVARFVVSLAAGDRRPARRLDGDAAQGTARAVRRERDARVDRSAASRSTTSAGRAARRSCGSASVGHHRSGAGHAFRRHRHHGGARSRRSCRRRRRSRSSCCCRASPRSAGDPLRAAIVDRPRASGISSKVSSRSGTANRRWRSSARTAPPSHWSRWPSSRPASSSTWTLRRTKRRLQRKLTISAVAPMRPVRRHPDSQRGAGLARAVTRS